MTVSSEEHVFADGFPRAFGKYEGVAHFFDAQVSENWHAVSEDFWCHEGKVPIDELLTQKGRSEGWSGFEKD